MKETTAHKNKKVRLGISGMTCSNCALTVSRFLEKQGGEEVSVRFTESAASFHLPEHADLSRVVSGIEDLGYEVTQSETERKAVRRGVSAIEKKLYFSALFTAPLFAHMFLPFTWLHHPYVQLALCLPVFGVGLWHFGRSAYYSLRAGMPNMDVLITLGASAAFLYSLTGTALALGPDYMFYETSAMIITLVLLGNVLEHRAVQRTASAMEELAGLQEDAPKRIVKGADGKETVEVVTPESLQKGDRLLVNTGDKVPVDGEVVWGEGMVDESMLSGESVPVAKSEGDQVVGGTMLQEGTLRMQATAVGDNTVLSHIIEMVREAQEKKPAVQRLADKISGVFVPVVTIIALLTFVLSFWAFGVTLQQSLMSSIAVLVIACPCALGLATPTAVMVGIGKAARMGILIKDAQVLEVIPTIRQVVFDKTGTLTTGRFRIKDIHSLNGMPEQEIADILFQLEQHSSHPIARSLVSAIGEAKGDLTLTSVNEEKGIGMKGKDKAGNIYRVGSYLTARHLTADNRYNLYVLKNDKLVAAVDIEDEVRPEARETMDWLHRQGIRTVLLSGDTQPKCEEVARKLGIDKVYAEQLPGQKLEVIEKLTAETPTAMVGDGVNDAPALTRATLGISMSNATQVAAESAQIILLKGNLSYLTKALKISRKTLATIKQNLFWAFFYNVLAIPVAAVGLLNPMIAALSMAFSDVVVIGNSMRLRIRKIT